MCVLAQGRGRQLKRSIFLTGPYCRFSFIEIPSNDFRLSIIISPSLLICSSPLFYFILTIIRQSLSSETKLFQIQILLVIRSLQIFITSLINCLDNVQNVSSKISSLSLSFETFNKVLLLRCIGFSFSLVLFLEKELYG